MRYRINSPQVISETVGGETIIVNLATGHYFNLQGTAVDVWEALDRREPSSRIVLQLQAHYEARDGEIDEAVSELVRRLEEADLIVPDDSDAPPEPPQSPSNGERRPFVAPSIATFSDMQDIILLDPVHEVDARGWPHAHADS